MQTITRDEYRKLERMGYASQSDVDGQTFILQLDKETGATVLAPVNVFPRLPKACCLVAESFGVVCKDCNKPKRTPKPRVKNLCAKTRPQANPYEVWTSYDGAWEWRVLKKYQVDDNKNFARWFCAVRSPFTYGSYEMGDCYVRDIVQHARKTA